MNRIYYFIIFFLFIFSIAFPNILKAQQDNTQYIETMIKEIKDKKGNMLGFASANIHHVYEITIPGNAEFTDHETITVIYPVEITLAVKENNYTLQKEKINYKVTIYKEYKGSYAQFMKKDKTVIWEVKKTTKEFQKTLKELDNLGNTEFETLYTPEDNFPSDWKN